MVVLLISYAARGKWLWRHGRTLADLEKHRRGIQPILRSAQSGTLTAPTVLQHLSLDHAKWRAYCGNVSRCRRLLLGLLVITTLFSRTVLLHQILINNPTIRWSRLLILNVATVRGNPDDVIPLCQPLTILLLEASKVFPVSLRELSKTVFEEFGLHQVLLFLLHL